jgi:predicted phage-related endonuclease
VTTIRELSRDEWLALRRETLGASEAAAACGESPYQSAIELWSYKTGLVEAPDLSDVEHIFWGNVHEPAIVKETCRREGLDLLDVGPAITRLRGHDDFDIVGVVEGRQLFLRSRIHPWMSATLDGIAVAGNGELVAIEAKTTGEWHRDEWEDGKFPEHHLLQVSHQLAVATSIPSALVAGLVGGNKLFISPRVERAAAPIDPLVQLEREFWRRVQENDAPPADGSESSAKTLKILHPDDNGQSIVLSDEVAALAERERELAALKSNTEAEYQRVRTLLKDAIGKNTFGVLPNGRGTYSLKTIEKDAYSVGATKYRDLRFSAPKSPKTTKRK